MCLTKGKENDDKKNENKRKAERNERRKKIPISRVVVLPKELQQIRIRNLLRVKLYSHTFRVIYI